MTPIPSLDALRRRARRLLRAAQADEAEALQRFTAAALPLRLTAAQLLIAREQGQPSWPALVSAAESAEALQLQDDAFERRLLTLAIGQGHAAPQPERAAALMAERPLRRPALVLLRGDLAGLQAAGIAPNAPLGPWQVSPLVYVAASSLARLPAFRDGLLATADWLIAHGADANARWVDAELHWDVPVLYGAVARARCEAMVERLLAAGANPNDNESLYHATEQAERGLIEQLVAAGARWRGTNALFRQLDFDALPHLQQCLRLGADVNEIGPGGLRPLQHALRRGRDLAHLRCLLEHGADPKLRDPHGHDAAWYALRCGETEALCLLTAGAALPPLSPEQAFLAACAAADGPRAHAALQAQPGLLRRLGHAGLHLLPDQAQRGRLASVRLMLELGWPVDVPGDWQASALNQAAFRGDARMVELLLAHGARWFERNGYGGDALGSCLHAACNEPVAGGDYAEVFRLLLADGAPPPEDLDELPAALRDQLP
jgi:ankyrin repeat protein